MTEFPTLNLLNEVPHIKERLKAGYPGLKFDTKNNQVTRDLRTLLKLVDMFTERFSDIQYLTHEEWIYRQVIDEYMEGKPLTPERLDQSWVELLKSMPEVEFRDGAFYPKGTGE